MRGKRQIKYIPSTRCHFIPSHQSFNRQSTQPGNDINYNLFQVFQPIILHFSAERMIKTTNCKNSRVRISSFFKILRSFAKLLPLT